MGRTHSEEFSHLPKGVYFNKKGKTYYLRRAGAPDVNLGKTLGQALSCYWSLPDIYYAPESMTDLINRYMAEISPTLADSTHASNKRAAAQLIVSFADFKPQDVRPIHIHQHLDKRRDSKTRANREVALLGSIFREAIRWGVIERSPVHKIQKFKETARTRLVTDAEIMAFKEHCPDWLKLYVDLKLMTALRETDMLEATFDMWSKHEGLRIEISKHKSTTKLIFNPTDCLKQLMDELWELQSVRLSKKFQHQASALFPNKNGTPYTVNSFQSAWRDAMIAALESGRLTERFQERDLRARAATDCGSIYEAFELCGHKSITTTKRIYRRGFNSVTPMKRITPHGHSVLK